MPRSSAPRLLYTLLTVLYEYILMVRTYPRVEDGVLLVVIITAYVAFWQLREEPSAPWCAGLFWGRPAG